MLHILTYGAYCWWKEAIKPAVARHLVSSQRMFMLFISKGCRTVSSVALQVLVGILPADLQVVLVGACCVVDRGLKVDGAGISVAAIDSFADPETKKKLINNAKQKIRNRVMEIWQFRWDNESRGRVTYDFIKDVMVGDREKWFKYEYEVTCFLTGHGFFRENLERFGLCDNPLCACGEIQSSNHLLFECTLLDEYRREVHQIEIPVNAQWYLQSEENFNKFKSIAKKVFDMHKLNLL